MIDLSPEGLARNTARRMLSEHTQLLSNAIQDTHEILGNKWDKQRFGVAVITHGLPETDSPFLRLGLRCGDERSLPGLLVSNDWQGNKLKYDGNELWVVRPSALTDDRDDLYYLDEEARAHERLRYEPDTNSVYFLTGSGKERELGSIMPPFGYHVEHSVNVMTRVRGALGGIATSESSVKFF